MPHYDTLTYLTASFGILYPNIMILKEIKGTEGHHVRL